jgi:translation initiation factor IF-3
MCGVFCSAHFCWRCFAIKTNEKSHEINEGIGFPASKEVRLIGPNGEAIGVTGFERALHIAYEHDLDLVLIAPQADPPVCRVMDYGKFRFERDKREKEAKKKQQTVEVKEIQLSCRIDTNDFNTKLNHAHRFLQSGNKVRVVVKFKGRQMSHTEIGAELLAKFQEACKDFGTVDKQPKMEGRFLSMLIAPTKQK